MMCLSAPVAGEMPRLEYDYVACNVAHVNSSYLAQVVNVENLLQNWKVNDT